MTPKERLLTALYRGKPDRLPVSVHQWQRYHLEKFMGGISALDACRNIGLDAQIQYRDDMSPNMHSHSEWRDIPCLIDGGPDSRDAHHTVETPRGNLSYRTAGDRKTTWITEHLIKEDNDIQIVEKYLPVPRLNLRSVEKAYDEIGDSGILRGSVWGDQPGCWQHAACLYDINDLILCTFEKPEWVHALLRILLEKKLRHIESMKGAPFDLVETGGGSASSTLISPDIFKNFCLPYDKKIHEALHDLGFKVSYHTCGGTRGIENMIVENGCDASETLAPTSVGGNSEPWEFAEVIDNRIAMIGGVDQFNVLTVGDRETIRSNVQKLFRTVGKNGGYICSLSDHFFETPVENLRWYAAAAHACLY